MGQTIRILMVPLLITAVLVVGGCEADRVTPPPPSTDFKSLEAKDDVPFNLEASYTARDIQEFTKLLDDDFEFHVSSWDYALGSIPPRWGRDDEVVANTSLFDPDYQGPWRATNIALKLSYSEWVPVTPEPGYSGEEWFRTDAVYNITIQTVSGVDLKGNNLRAQLIIRPSEVDGKTIWRIIRWKDFGEYSSGIDVESAAVAESTWGSIKALYHGDFFKDVTEKDDALYNLEMSYNLRNIRQFTRLLDDEFVFFFSEADYSGGDVPVSWERPDEIVTTTNLFNPNLPGPLRAMKIDLRMTYPKGLWTEVPQGDDETWYSKEVDYSIDVWTAAGVDYKGYHLRAQFFVREVIPEGETEKVWQIVRWRDLADDSRSFDVSASSAVHESTWGSIKALYK